MSNTKLAVKPLNSLYAAKSSGAVLLKMHGGGGAAIAITASASSIERGYPTIVTLASAPSAIAGQYVYLALDAGDTMTALTGYHRVISARSGNRLALDVDTSDYAAFSFAGSPTCNFNVISDSFGNVPPQSIQGTITGIWANQGDGITGDPTAGNNTPLITDAASLAAFNLAGYRGLVAIAAHVKTAVPSSGASGLFQIGTNGTTATYGLSGAFQIQIVNNTSPSILYKYRPKRAGSVGADQSIGANAAHNLTAGARTHIGIILDLRDFATAYVHYYKDGILAATTALTQTTGIDWPDVSNGVCIGAVISSNDLALSGKMGTNCTTTGTRMENFGWWRDSAATMAEMVQYLKDMRDFGEPVSMLIS